MTAFISQLADRLSYLTDGAWNVIALVWTPACVVIFLLIFIYALWPARRNEFDDAAKMPLRED
jgi:cytochrome c oxidase cbb3-type subunit IV